jgi:hypothetical protein
MESDGILSFFGIGTDEVIRVDGPRHPDHRRFGFFTSPTPVSHLTEVDAQTTN